MAIRAFQALILLSLFATLNLNAQVYHHETGLIIPNGKPGQVLWGRGTFHGFPAKFGTLIAKENPKSYTSKLITLPVVLIKSTNTSNLQEPIFILHGGPGESNLQDKLLFGELLRYHDLVFVGYRGVDGTTKLDCDCYSETLFNDSLSINNAKQLFAEAFANCMEEWEKKRVDIYGYSMESVLLDLEMVRTALHYESISFLAFSYGTMLAQEYAIKYPQNTRKLSLIGARPLDDFIFSVDEYKKQMLNLFSLSQNKRNIQVSNEINDSFSVMDSLFYKVKTNTAEINPYRLMFYGFSKLYSMENLDQFFYLYDQAQQGNSEALINDINRFYKNFPAEIAIGDMIVKKQGRVNTASYPDSSKDLANQITNSVNWFYSPKVDLLVSNVSNKNQLDTSIQVQILSGEFDIASPPGKLQEKLLRNNISPIVIPGAGHLDLLLSKREILNGYILEFYNN